MLQIEGKLNYLVSARPTAVNIKIGAEELIQLANALSADENVTPQDFKERYENIHALLIILFLLCSTLLNYYLF